MGCWQRNHTLSYNWSHTYFPMATMQIISICSLLILPLFPAHLAVSFLSKLISFLHAGASQIVFMQQFSFWSFLFVSCGWKLFPWTCHRGKKTTAGSAFLLLPRVLLICAILIFFFPFPLSYHLILFFDIEQMPAVKAYRFHTDLTYAALLRTIGQSSWTNFYPYWMTCLYSGHFWTA